VLTASLLALPAIMLAGLAWIFFKDQPLSRVYILAMSSGIGYWYVLPGTLFLLGGDVAAVDSDLLRDEAAVFKASLLVHVSFAALLLLPLTFRLRPKTQRAPIFMTTECTVRLNVLLVVTVASSILLLAYRYADLGPAFALQLLVGLASAREVMSFDNFSSGPGQSLLALWEIVNLFLAVFFGALFTWQRRILTGQFVGASAAIILSFVSSGSRSTLLLFLFAIFFSIICRPPATVATGVKSTTGKNVRRLLPIIAIAALIGLAVAAMVARFEDSPAQSESLALNSIGGHNDMFRELVFVIRNGWSYQSDAWLFLQTPLTYAMPTFLGFNKSIAPHLIDFNFDRAGIDLVFGVGNVFPGLLADMFICFGPMAPVALCLFTAAVFAIAVAVTRSGRESTISQCLLISLLCYYVTSFRNLQGAFGILIVLAYILARLLSADVRRTVIDPPTHATPSTP